MQQNELDFITNDDIEDLGLKVLKNMGRWHDGPSPYIQMGDEAGVFDDGSYTCHYELIFMGEDTPEFGNHKKYQIYVEIHFESEMYSPFFQSVIIEMLKNPELESFAWRDFCPGLRLKNSVFSVNDKDMILQNLQNLKNLTIDKLVKTYKNTVSINNNWRSSFSLEKGGRKCSSTRALSEFYREPKEVYIVHEKIKKTLIKQIRSNPELVCKNDPIDVSSLSPENLVNNINYIDLAAKTINGKIIFFEIKTSNEARLCIRQAFGQLMEYSFYPNTSFADKIIVVGPAVKTSDIQKYLKQLNTKFKINIDYIEIKP